MDLKPKKKEDEPEYERMPRQRKDDFELKLPTKTLDGKLVQQVERKTVKEEEPEVEQLKAPVKEKKPVKEQPVSSKKQTVVQVKESLAQMATQVIEDPENNIGSLRIIRGYTGDSRPEVVSLALLTLLAVFKDIIPGYRIRKRTDKEEQVQISKEVKKLRNFEDGLLSNYQQYLQKLEELSRAKTQPILADLSVKCMADLLKSATHFNFRLNLITAIVSKMVSKKSVQICELCADALKYVFENDQQGEASLEAVKVMADQFKYCKYDVLPQALSPLLYLKLTKSDAPRERKQKKKKKEEHVSKKQKKLNEYREEVEREMKEAEAEYDKQEIAKHHSESLKLLFFIYFSILKRSKESLLLPIVLEGLAQFAHMINIDFFDDLLSLLKDIAKTQFENYSQGKHASGSSLISALHCIIATFELLDSLGGSLILDLKDFYCSLYQLLVRFASTPSSEITTSNTRSETQLLISGIEWMLKRNREIPISRVAAFVKRLATVSLFSNYSATEKITNVIYKAFQRFPQLDALVESEGQLATGRYNPYMDEPDMCNPFATSLWEYSLLMVFHLIPEALPSTSGPQCQISLEDQRKGPD
ncbi:nucleolar complex-associated protein-domain-containing protein [Gorgonomyces haynaldii]|nr:nucleolar complex-associated protein-domain-containing protein [Gorgonomyces haynaldii]